jgi:hypothetical protein
MTYETLTVEHAQDQTVLVTLNRPEVASAMSQSRTAERFSGVTCEPLSAGHSAGEGDGPMQLTLEIKTDGVKMARSVNRRQTWYRLVEKNRTCMT